MLECWEADSPLAFCNRLNELHNEPDLQSEPSSIGILTWVGCFVYFFIFLYLLFDVALGCGEQINTTDKSHDSSGSLNGRLLCLEHCVVAIENSCFYLSFSPLLTPPNNRHKKRREVN